MGACKVHVKFRSPNVCYFIDELEMDPFFGGQRVSGRGVQLGVKPHLLNHEPDLC